MSQPTDFEVRVRTLRHEAKDVISLELVPYGGAFLPRFTAGSHIDVHLPNGLSRSYSVMNPQGDVDRYLIGVYRDPKSRGGSKYIHDELRVGKLLRISAPRNNFPLAEISPRNVFIAGGIGVTPFCSMLDRLNALGKKWLLYYCVRTREHAGFIDRLEHLAAAGGSDIIFNFDREPGGQVLDIATILALEPPDAQVYCCGPMGMLNAFKEACQSRKSEFVHLEYFSSAIAPAVKGGFKVVLARSGRSVFVPEGNTILEVLLAEGLDIPYSCQQGICAACETTVLAGVPDHRDMILTPDQQASNKVMMICCSGSKSDEIVLDR
jgi:tetrachlorobenzoquinone reductase